MHTPSHRIRTRSTFGEAELAPPPAASSPVDVMAVLVAVGLAAALVAAGMSLTGGSGSMSRNGSRKRRAKRKKPRLVRSYAHSGKLDDGSLSSFFVKGARGAKYVRSEVIGGETFHVFRTRSGALIKQADANTRSKRFKRNGHRYVVLPAHGRGVTLSRDDERAPRFYFKTAHALEKAFPFDDIDEQRNDDQGDGEDFIWYVTLKPGASLKFRAMERAHPKGR